MESNQLPMEFIMLIQQGNIGEIQKAVKQYQIDLETQLAPTLKQTALFFTPYIQNEHK